MKKPAIFLVTTLFTTNAFASNDICNATHDWINSVTGLVKHCQSSIVNSPNTALTELMCDIAIKEVGKVRPAVKDVEYCKPIEEALKILAIETNNTLETTNQQIQELTGLHSPH